MILIRWFTFRLRIVLGVTVSSPLRKPFSFTVYVFSLAISTGSGLSLYCTMHTPPPRSTNVKYWRMTLSTVDPIFTSLISVTIWSVMMSTFMGSHIMNVTEFKLQINRGMILGLDHADILPSLRSARNRPNTPYSPTAGREKHVELFSYFIDP